jgi:hypothetical protein
MRVAPFGVRARTGSIPPILFRGDGARNGGPSLRPRLVAAGPSLGAIRPSAPSDEMTPP